MESETWKDIIGQEDRYQVSTFGRVRSLIRGNVILRQCFDSYGYLMVGLCKDGIKKTFSVHSLVAKMFIDESYREKCLVVNHKNFKKDDNNLSNLEVITQRENSNLKHIQSVSKYTGVTFSKKANKWESRIKVGNKRIYLGYFNSEDEASKYYEAALFCVKENRINDIKRNLKKSIF